MAHFVGTTASSSDPLTVASNEFTAVQGREDKGRLERDLMSESRVTGRSPGWLDGEIQHTSEMVWYGSRLRPFDHIFKEMKVKDPDLASFDIRVKSTVLTLPREIIPGDSSDGAQEAVELCRQQIRLLSGGAESADMRHGGNQWMQFLYALLENVWSGTAFIEPNWNDDFFIDELVHRPMHHFGFRETGSGGARLSMRRVGALEEIPPGKIIFARNSLEGFPWGDPMAQYVYWIWKAKIYNLLDWALFLERWAKPVTDVEYEAVDLTGVKDSMDSAPVENNSREMSAIAAAKGIHGNGYFVHNDKTKLNLLNTNVSGGEQFLAFYKMCTQQEARLLISEITTPGLEGFGSLKKAQVSERVGSDRQKYFAPSVSSVVESTIFTWLVQTHLPGATVPFYRLNALSAESYNRLFKGIEAKLGSGGGVPETHADMVWGMPETKPNETLITRLMAKEVVGQLRETTGVEES